MLGAEGDQPPPSCRVLPRVATLPVHRIGQGRSLDEVGSALPPRDGAGEQGGAGRADESGHGGRGEQLVDSSCSRSVPISSTFDDRC